MAAPVDLGGFALVLHPAVPIAVAWTLNFGVALPVNYTLTARFVLQERSGLHRLPAFALGAVLGLCLSMGVTLGLSALGKTPLLTECAGIGTAFMFNYSINAIVVFRR